MARVLDRGTNPHTSIVSLPSRRWAGADAVHRADTVVVEEPLQIHVEWRGDRTLLGSTMRTPGDDLALAAGLAVAEGVVTHRSQISSIRHCDGPEYHDNDVVVSLQDDVTFDPSGLGRVSHPSSACGLCGRDQIDAILDRMPYVDRAVSVDAHVLAGLPDAMTARQRVFRRTGGLHAAAAATSDGDIVLAAEDVGRHNAVDKVVGAALLADQAPIDILVVSSRLGFEIVAKAAMAGIPVVAAVSAPTSLAIELATQCGLTLAAFVRGTTMTLYCGFDRVRTADGSPW